jgi:hypothetical protein
MVNAKANDVKFGRKPGSPRISSATRGGGLQKARQSAALRAATASQSGDDFPAHSLAPKTGAVALKLTSVNGRTTAEEPRSA